MRETVGDRIYEIRLALGDGKRSPMPMRPFADLLNTRGSRNYNSTNVSLLERGKQRASLEDIEIIASADPRARGRSWLAFGVEPSHLTEMRGELPEEDVALFNRDIIKSWHVASEGETLDEVRSRLVKMVQPLVDSFLSIAPQGGTMQRFANALEQKFVQELNGVANRHSAIEYAGSFVEYLYLIARVDNEHANALLKSVPEPPLEAYITINDDAPGSPVKAPPAQVLGADALYLDRLDANLQMVSARRRALPPKKGREGRLQRWRRNTLAVLEAQVRGFVRGVGSSTLGAARMQNRVNLELHTIVGGADDEFALREVGQVLSWIINATAANTFLKEALWIPTEVKATPEAVLAALVRNHAALRTTGSNRDAFVEGLPSSTSSGATARASRTSKKSKKRT